MPGIDYEIAKSKKIRITESQHKEIMRFDDDGAPPFEHYEIVPDPKQDPKTDLDSALNWKYIEQIKL